MTLPKLVMTDIDGVWTDGGMYYDQTGNEWKKFNTSDSAGVLFLRLMKIPTAIITGEDTAMVKRRAEKLKVDHLFMGIKKKVETTQQLLDKLGISWNDVAYIGDDINDMLMLEKVGFSAAPDNAPDYIKSLVDFVVPVKGGDGAYRHFVEYILKSCNVMDEALTRYKSRIS